MRKTWCCLKAPWKQEIFIYHWSITSTICKGFYQRNSVFYQLASLWILSSFLVFDACVKQWCINQLFRSEENLFVWPLDSLCFSLNALWGQSCIERQTNFFPWCDAKFCNEEEKKGCLLECLRHQLSCCYGNIHFLRGRKELGRIL